MSQTNIFHTDRSRIVTAHRCKRARFWGYEVQVDAEQAVLGLTPDRLSIPMLIGSAVHEGLEVLHAAYRFWELTEESAEVVLNGLGGAMAIALDTYNKGVEAWETSTVTLDAEMANDENAWLDAVPDEVGQTQKMLFKIAEGRALVEALMRVYEKVGLQMLLGQYRILMVEKEMSSVIAESELDSLAVQLNGRADAIMQERATGNLVVLSIKTAKALDQRASKNWTEDDQGISECYLVQQMVKQGLLAEYGYPADSAVQVGVQMLYLLKGTEYADKHDGIWKHGSPLVRPFTQEAPDGSIDFRPKWNWIDDSGANRVLGKAWRATSIWEVDANNPNVLAEWIEDMYVNHHDVLSAQVLLPDLYLRTDVEIADWVTETAMQEMGIATLRLEMARAEGFNIEAILAGEFPKTRSACNYPTACDFKRLCHPVSNTYGMSDEGLALLTSGLVQVTGFKPRTPNHGVEGSA